MDFWTPIQMKWQWHQPQILYWSTPVKKFDDWQLMTGDWMNWVTILDQQGTINGIPTLCPLRPSMLVTSEASNHYFYKHTGARAFEHLNLYRSLQHSLLAIQTSFGGGFPQHLLLEPIFVQEVSLLGNWGGAIPGERSDWIWLHSIVFVVGMDLLPILCYFPVWVDLENFRWLIVGYVS